MFVPKYTWQKVTPPYSGHLSTTDDKFGPIGVCYMEVQLYQFVVVGIRPLTS